jgi:hypothetical protein
MKEMTKLVLLVVPLMILVGYSWVFVLPYYAYDDPLERAPAATILGTLWAVGITIVAVVLIAWQYRSLRAGFQLLDERSQGIAIRAGYYSFWISIAWWMLLNVVILTDTNAFGLFTRYHSGEALVGGMLALPVIYFLVWSYLVYRYRPRAG